MSKGAVLDTRELLRLMCEQQATLVKLQQLVFEYVLADTRPNLATGSSPVAPAVSEAVAAARLPAVTSATAQAVTPIDQDEVSSTEQALVPEPSLPIAPETGPGSSPAPDASTPPSSETSPAPPVTADSPFGETPPMPADPAPATTSVSAPSALSSRASRYLNPRVSAPAKQVTNQELHRLHLLRDVGDVAQLVLQFGEYRGVTLFQVAQTDPDYLRSLALTAQRPQVRAAAMQLVRALEASEPAPARRRSTRTNSGRHDR